MAKVVAGEVPLEEAPSRLEARVEARAANRASSQLAAASPSLAPRLARKSSANLARVSNRKVPGVNRSASRSSHEAKASKRVPSDSALVQPATPFGTRTLQILLRTATIFCNPFIIST